MDDFSDILPEFNHPHNPVHSQTHLQGEPSLVPIDHDEDHLGGAARQAALSGGDGAQPHAAGHSEDTGNDVDLDFGLPSDSLGHGAESLGLGSATGYSGVGVGIGVGITSRGVSEQFQPRPQSQIQQHQRPSSNLDLGGPSQVRNTSTGQRVSTNDNIGRSRSGSEIDQEGEDDNMEGSANGGEKPMRYSTAGATPEERKRMQREQNRKAAEKSRHKKREEL